MKSKPNQKSQPAITKETIVTKTAGKNLVMMLGLLCAILGVVLYINTINHDYTIDDDTVMAKNTIVNKGISGLPEIFTTPYRKGFWDRKEALYRPLSLAMFAIEWQIAPEKPWLSHMVNIIIYALTGLILFHALRLLLYKSNIFLPFFTTILFIAHPIHTEVVANIKSRDELLCFLFFISSVYYLFRFIRSDVKNKSMIVMSCLFFILSLLSKESAVTFIFVYPLCIYFFSDSGLKKSVVQSTVFIIPLLIYFGMRYNAIQGITNSLEILPINNSLITAPDGISRFATAIKILGKYFALLVFPHPLSFDYSFNTISISGMADPMVLLSLAIYISLLVYAIRKFKSKNIYSFSILFFLITISLISNVFFLIESTMAERFLYTASLGFCLATTLLISELLKVKNYKVNFDSVTTFLKSYKSASVTILIILLLYSTKTISRNMDWKDNLTILRKDMKTCPESCRIRFAYGSTLLMKYAMKEENPFKKSVMIDDVINNLEKGVAILPTYSEAFFHLGLAYSEKKDYANAVRCFDAAAQSKDWDDAEFAVSSGLAYHMFGQCDKAEVQFKKAIKKSPEQKEAYSNWGLCLTERGKIPEAISLLDKATTLDSTYSTAWYNKGNAYAQGKDFNMAIQCYNKTLSIDPNNIDAKLNVGNCYGAMGDTKNALTTFEQVLQTDPANKKALTNISVTYRMMGDMAKADEFMRRAEALQN